MPVHRCISFTRKGKGKSGQYPISSSSCIRDLTSETWEWLLWCIIPQWMGMIREAVKKHFLKDGAVDFLEAKQFESTQLQWAYFLSLYPLHMDPDGNGLQLLHSESIAALEGRTHSIFTEKLQKSRDGHYGFLTEFFIWVRQTEHKLGVLEACLTAWVTQKIPSIPKLAFSVISRDGSLVWSKQCWTSLTKK